VGGGRALLLGDMPLESCIRNDKSGVACVVRAFFLDDDYDVLISLDSTDLDMCPEVERAVLYEVEQDHLCLFDSALTGQEARDEWLRFSILAGAYQVTTHALEPTDRISLLIHRFNLHP
jgi:hypothetical protein